MAALSVNNSNMAGWVYLYGMEQAADLQRLAGQIAAADRSTDVPS